MQISEFTSRTLFRTQSGRWFKTNGEPVIDTSGVLRVVIKEADTIGSASDVYQIAIVDIPSVYSGGINIDGVRIFLASRLQGDPITQIIIEPTADQAPVTTVANGVYEVKGGGRLLVEGDNFFFGKNGEVTRLTREELLALPDLREIKSIRVAASARVSTIPRGVVFSTLVEGEYRFFVRRDHGIAPVDGGAKVTLQAIQTLAATQLTRVGTTYVPRVGEAAKIGSSQIAKVIAVEDTHVYYVTPDNLILEYVGVAPRSPVGSEFRDAETWAPLATQDIVHYPDCDVVFPEPQNISALVEGSHIKYDGVHARVREIFEYSDVVVRLYMDRVITDRDDFGQYNSTRDDLGCPTGIKGPGGVYGLKRIEVLATPAVEAPVFEVPGTLYRGPLTDYYAVLSLDSEGRKRLMYLRVGNYPDNESPRLFDDCGTSFVKIAGPGEWGIEINPQQVIKKMVATTPFATVNIHGVKLPLADELSLRHLRRALTETCPRCQSLCRPGSRRNVYTETPTGYRAVEELQVCGTCAADSHPCPSCRRTFTHRLTHALGSCVECVNTGNVNVIHDYSYRPAPKFHGSGPLFYGTEVELQVSGHRRSTALQVITLAKGLFYAKRDGSIGDGVEFVTHPFSLPWLSENEESLSLLFSYIKNHTFPDQRCGIHIHASKEGFEVDPSTITVHSEFNKKPLTKNRLIGRGLMRVQRFIYGNPDLVVHFAGRRNDQYASLRIQDTPVKEMKRLAENVDSIKNRRYAAVNMTEKTVEFRIFRSTNDYSEYKRNLLFIDSVIQYCRTRAIPKNGTIGVKAYEKFLEADELYGPVLDHLRGFMNPGAAAPQRPRRNAEDDAEESVPVTRVHPVPVTPPELVGTWVSHETI